MAENKTKKTAASVEEFIDGVADEQKREDSRKLVEIMRQITKQEPAMWGGGIVGFGSCHYRYASGREGDWMLVGFSPRKQALSLYLTCDLSRLDEELLEKLGPVKTGKGCLYVKRLSDIHLPALKKLIRQSVKQARQQAD